MNESKRKAKSRGVLVSYAREDEKWVRWFVRQLQSVGFTVWWDRTSNFPGADYRFEIREAIRDCDAFIFIATDTSLSRGEGGYWGELRDCYPRYREMVAGRKFIFVVNVDCNKPIPDERIRSNESLRDLVATELSRQIQKPDKATKQKMKLQFLMLVKELEKVSPRQMPEPANVPEKRIGRNEVARSKNKRRLFVVFRSMLLRTILAITLLTVFWLGVPAFAIVLASQYKTDFGVFPMLIAFPFGLASASVALIKPKIIGRICYSL
ncbi:toll/interleukin-1 receptor domain-containing protein [Roseiconus lacunae]|uniref:toll/interleukin-1 receptor domain-containing protein n=1 Tax=Roseiconus lacunae TaxID=2605694 RepID=UPI001E4B9841|nr:toll/interleukin-1 receptor domain-containing protein [Roseiconus lacunae]MCD0460689.1 toll/interleukin-1 receptor domain-containing protein [Roseiconus lacunae]